jgi:magnesium transporter
MKRQVYPFATFRWVDVVAPKDEDLRSLGVEFGLHPEQVRDCLTPEHLPKAEVSGETTFLVLRSYDSAANQRSGTIQQMTRKTALFIKPGLVLTVHRSALPFLDALLQVPPKVDLAPEGLLIDILRAVLGTYSKPIEKLDLEFQKLESSVFDREADGRVFKQIYQIKRRLSVSKRILAHSATAMGSLDHLRRSQPQAHLDLMETTQGLVTATDMLQEEAQQLLNLQISLASHQSNEVMRVLTLFSAIFLPLTFIAGVYGMNFKEMPELQHRLGYPLTLTAMLIVALGLGAYFYRRGWLKQR